jgi:hypothetical protein
MSLLANDTKFSKPATIPVAPARSRLFAELLDSNHDAWRAFRDGEKWTFYREIGDGRPHLPYGAVVLTTEPGKPQTLDFFSTKGKRSLLATYADEVGAAAQQLIEREHIIALFTHLARQLECQSWDHKLSFCGAQVSERCVELQVGTPTYQRLVGDMKARTAPRTAVGLSHPARTQKLGLSVSQHEQNPPFVECCITYPRPIQARFFSFRLAGGLDVITNPMASVVTEHNRNLEERYGECDGERW